MKTLNRVRILTQRSNGVLKSVRQDLHIYDKFNFSKLVDFYLVKILPFGVFLTIIPKAKQFLFNAALRVRELLRNIVTTHSSVFQIKNETYFEVIPNA